MERVETDSLVDYEVYLPSDDEYYDVGDDPVGGVLRGAIGAPTTRLELRKNILACRSPRP